MKQVFQEIIGEAKALVTSVLLSSHILADLQSHARTWVHATLDRVPDATALSMLSDVHVDGNRLTASADADRIGEAMTAIIPY